MVGLLVVIAVVGVVGVLVGMFLPAVQSARERKNFALPQ